MEQFITRKAKELAGGGIGVDATVIGVGDDNGIRQRAEHRPVPARLIERFAFGRRKDLGHAKYELSLEHRF